jgi:hypothetical protein
MSLDSNKRRSLLKEGKFPALFNDMGWDGFHVRMSVPVGEETFVLSPVAEKRGVQVFSVTDSNGKVPTSATRRKMEREVTKIAAEHLLIFHDTAFKEQIWQWVAREPHKPAQVREIVLHPNQSGEALLQKLDRISFALSQEESLSIVAVATKLKDAFDRDRVTKRFYERFKQEHGAFPIVGITTGDNDKRWYTSVMINRIMFLYFVQSKGFLNRDTDYLKNRLAGSAGKYGKDKFYQSFLCPLFFEGLAKRESERKPDIRADLGKLPYLSGSLFVEHEIEARNATIEIPDVAFEKLFAFLDEYNWHLDDRPVSDGRHINPDVLGYIFEKYINQKQMGAYYTKEDITEYISKNTILPFVLERTKEKCEVAFAGEYSVWRLLSDDPDRYIYPAVRKGCDLPLPANIEVGIADVSKRGDWNQHALASHALPTEIWRETVARRQRYAEVHGKLSRGEVTSASDLITLNLNIRQFVQDVVEQSEGADLLRAVWETLNGNKVGTVPPLSVLDPTCGSGAFLFAAVEILLPLYTACIERMRGFVDDADRVGRPNDHRPFRETLAEIATHPNEPYFILKKIITHNLFGVDIMDEATEICKLRLFLKLAAQVEPDESKDNLGIEPLPDIDFNIRAGNTLVGFATEKQMHNAVSGSLALDGQDEKWNKFKADLEAYDGLFGDFLKMQERGDFTSAFAEAQKAGLRAKLQPLRDQADELLAHQYGKIGKDAQAVWKATAKPFHWFVEFYRTLRSGGFDCIIGNPPYVEYSKVRQEYTIRSYDTESSGNLYAFVMERNKFLVCRQGYSGMIVPHSGICTDRMQPVIALLDTPKNKTWLSSYDIRPSKLFVGVDQRLAIYVTQHEANTKLLHTSAYYRWSDEYRPMLLSMIEYADVSEVRFPNSIPKIKRDIERDIWSKIQKTKKFLFAGVSATNRIFYHNAPRYWIRAMDSAPYFWNERGGEQVSVQVKTLSLDKESQPVVMSCLNSSLFYWWFIILSDCRHLNLREIENFPMGVDKMAKGNKGVLADLASQMMQSLRANAKRKDCVYRTTGRVVYDEFYPKYSKPIIDEIDRVLAAHYGFTDEELDFIINYDIKYRMGLVGGGDEDEGEE